MGLVLLDPPSAEPVTLAEAKAHLRVTSSSEDSGISDAISDATRYVEKYTRMSLMKRKYRLVLDAFTPTIELPMGPVTEIDQVAYTDTAGDEQIVDEDFYTFDGSSKPQWLILNSGGTWPTPMTGVNMVRIDYFAGSDIFPPQFRDIRRAILLLLTEFYENRSAGAVEASTEKAICMLIGEYRMPTLA